MNDEEEEEEEIEIFRLEYIVYMCSYTIHDGNRARNFLLIGVDSKEKREKK